MHVLPLPADPVDDPVPDQQSQSPTAIHLPRTNRNGHTKPLQATVRDMQLRSGHRVPGCGTSRAASSRPCGHGERRPHSRTRGQHLAELLRLALASAAVPHPSTEADHEPGE
ncbi:hypothetical protein GCM10023257_18090 [Streptomyces hyderabadensis]|uniref:Uncharacterized protein n=1 Tax=Streptomyces hyderabadensis TaxID=598549 RepID=A0ABP9HX52_9ACTN